MSEPNTSQTHDNPNSVPYLAFESSQARSERTNKRLIIIVMILVFALLITNCGWLYVFQSYDYESYTVDLTTDDGGSASYIGQDGDINNGERASSAENP